MQKDELGYRYQKNMRWRKAAFYWSAILADAPSDEYALSNLLKCQSMIGDFVNAQRTAERLMDFNELSDDSAISLADYYFDIEHPGTALDYYRLIKDNSSFYLLSQLGSALCNMKLQQLSDAEDSVRLAKDVPIQMWQEYASWSQVYLSLRDYRSSAAAWYRAAAHAESFNVKVYALSTLLSLPLLAMRDYSETVYLGIMAIVGLLFMFLIPPWSLVLYLILLPVFVGVVIRHILIGRTRNNLGVMITMLSLLILAFLDIE